MRERVTTVCDIRSEDLHAPILYMNIIIYVYVYVYRVILIYIMLWNIDN